MKRKIFLTLFILILSVSLVGCFSGDSKDASSQKLQSLKIGVMPDLDSIPFIIAQHNGYFEDEGLNVQIEHFKSAVDRDTAIQTGNLDGAISDMLAVVFFNDNKFDIKITSKTDGSFKLLAGKNANINHLQQIKGKTIGISKNTIIEYLTDQILKNSQVDINSPEKVAIPKIPTRLEMLQNNKLDMATLPEPLASIAITNGSKVLSSSDHLGINPGVMIFTSDAIGSKTNEIKALYKAYNRAIDYLKKEKLESYIDVLIKDAGFPEAIKQTLTLPDYTKAALPSEKELKEVLYWLQAKELTSNSYSLKELSDDRFVD